MCVCKLGAICVLSLHTGGRLGSVFRIFAHGQKTWHCWCSVYLHMGSKLGTVGVLCLCIKAVSLALFMFCICAYWQ